MRRNRRRFFRDICGKMFKRRINMNTGAITCECLKCGYTTSTEGHCIDIPCPKCGGQMRRADRPGIGR